MMRGAIIATDNVMIKSITKLGVRWGIEQMKKNANKVVHSQHGQDQ